MPQSRNGYLDQVEWERKHAWKVWAALLVAIIALSVVCSRNDPAGPRYRYDDPRDDPHYDENYIPGLPRHWQ